MKAAGARPVGDFSGFSVTGLTEALRVLPRSYAMLKRLVAAARERRPDVFVAIDFPDFNFRLMAALHAARHSDRLLRQPAAVGVAARPHGDDEAVGRQGAGHLSVRSAAVRASGRARSSSSGIRWSIWRARDSRGRPFSATGARARRADRRAAAGKPAQ